MSGLAAIRSNSQVTLADQRARQPAAHRARRNAPGRPKTLRPLDHAGNAYREPRGNLAARTACLNPRNYPRAKVFRIGLHHPYWPPAPASILNQIPSPLGIHNRFNQRESRSRARSTQIEALAPEEFRVAGRRRAKRVAGPTGEPFDDPATRKAPALRVGSCRAPASLRRSTDGPASLFAARLADRLATTQRRRFNLGRSCSRSRSRSVPAGASDRPRRSGTDCR